MDWHTWLWCYHFKNMPTIAFKLHKRTKLSLWVWFWSKSWRIFKKCVSDDALQSNNLLDLEDRRDFKDGGFRPQVAKLLRNINLIEEASAAQWYQIIKSRNNCALCLLKISDLTPEIWNHHSGDTKPKKGRGWGESF